MKGCENLVIILSCDSNKLIYLTFKIFTIMKKNETNVENPVIEQIVMDEELKIGALLKDKDDNVLEEMWGIDLADIL